ncbi:DUF7344 domain-containing protein [Halorussus marinus]|uniref:DUF7344 domain-containing protein n=1 Tax=Halorussus marinus TaxID=2505976 RepID=UPI001ADA7CC3|nr:hypothetical protein [Halorussus marinus]
MTTIERRYDMLADAGPRGAEPDAPTDAVFDAVADARCRSLLDHLAERADGERIETAVADLADEVDVDCLHHAVLPKLDDAGFLDYDAESRTVSYRSEPRLEAVLAATDDLDELAEVGLDALLDALGDFRRRCVLAALLSHADLPLADLADEVTVEERGRPLSSVDAQTVLEVYLSLYHTHVPKLSDAGLVAYDQQRDLVALTDAGRELEPAVRSLCSSIE